MGKILYPVGTMVKVVKNLGDYTGERDVGLVAKVVGYTKKDDYPQIVNGVSFPYKIRFDDGHVATANVKELRRYKGEEVPTERADQPEREPTEHADVDYYEKEKELYRDRLKAEAEFKQQETYGRNEVDLMMGNLLDHIDSLYSELAAQIRKTQDVTDQNMLEIAKAFRIHNQRNQKLAKTLCHDDD